MGVRFLGIFDSNIRILTIFCNIMYGTINYGPIGFTDLKHILYRISKEDA